MDSLKNLKRFVFLTGAGISQESGIPTFRGSDGLWKKYDPMKLASISAFYENPKLVWEFYNDRQKLIQTCKPNFGHIAIAEIEKLQKYTTTVLTQNIDGLHKLAGSNNIVELHGNILKTKCMNCLEIKDIANGSIESIPPTCDRCSSILKPDIILFGEPLCQEVWKKAEETSLNCDVLFVVGTSLNVGPVNQLPIFAKRNGSILVEINLDLSVLNSLMDFTYQKKAVDVLPSILHILKK